jgi:hypothetical protein
VDLWRWIRNQSDRALAIALTIAGLVVIYLGWLGVSGHVLPAEQIPYLASDAVLGLFLLGVAGTLWLSADMRDEWRKLDIVAEELRRANDLAEAAAVRAQQAADDAAVVAEKAALNGVAAAAAPRAKRAPSAKPPARAARQPR